jgi:hypothetical protein
LSREGLQQQIGGKLAEAESALDAASDARLAARTFPTAPLLKKLQEKRAALTSEAVVGSKIKPKIIEAPVSAAATKEADRAFLLRWLADDLEEIGYQKGGSTKASRDAAYDAADATDDMGKRGMVFNPRVAGTPTQQMFEAAGIKGTRPQLAARINKAAGKDPQLNAFADALAEAWDGNGFDFDLVSEDALRAANVRRRDLRSPVTMPRFDDFGPDTVARWFPDADEATGAAATGEPTKIARKLGRDVVPGPNSDRVQMIDQAIAELKRLGPVARYESVRRLRQSYDGPAKAIYSQSMTADYLKAQGGKLGAADVTGTLREALAEWDPPTAAANADYSLWRKANDVLEATAEVERTRPKVGRQIAARIAATVFGGQAAGAPGAAAGLVLGPTIESILASGGTTKLQTAKLMTQLAEAIRKGDQGRVASLSTRIKRLAPTGATGASQATTARDSQVPSGALAMPALPR